MKTIKDINFEGKKALVRVDFNVPLDAEFNVTDITRIKAAKPTIIKILEDGGAAVLMSHLGRPKGVESKFSLGHIVEKVSEVLGVQAKFVDSCVGADAEAAVAALQPGEVLILENLRFHKEETAGKPPKYIIIHEISKCEPEPLRHPRAVGFTLKEN